MAQRCEKTAAIASSEKHRPCSTYESELFRTSLTCPRQPPCLLGSTNIAGKTHSTISPWGLMPWFVRCHRRPAKGRRLNSISIGGYFLRVRNCGVSAGLGLQTFDTPHPRNFFSVRLASCGCTAGLHGARPRLCTRPCLASAHDTTCALALSRVEQAGQEGAPCKHATAPPWP